ncbi:hypothetical protein VTJ04DRAFT_8713 [Mycothermus thermophilus]|uniref:uncharacterized protein n=1 Tax=Humicola insolens TaxID=85995 RepID=UPI0037426297
MNPNVGVAFLYCNYRQKEEQHAEDLIANLFKQLATGLDHLPRPLETLYFSYLRRRPPLTTLVSVLISVAALYKEGVLVVVDALDECQLSDKNRSRLISALLDFHSAKGTKANLMVTSRPGIPDIIAAFDKYPKLNILADTKTLNSTSGATWMIWPDL